MERNTVRRQFNNEEHRKRTRMEQEEASEATREASADWESAACLEPGAVITLGSSDPVCIATLIFSSAL